MIPFTKLKHPSDARVVRDASGVRAGSSSTGFMFPLHDKCYDLRLSVESSALFTLKNDEHSNRLLCRLLSSHVHSLVMSPDGTTTGTSYDKESTKM